jgi:hypothetical protein
LLQVAETAYDTVANIRGGNHENLMGRPAVLTCPFSSDHV